MATKKIGASIVLEGNKEYNRALKEIQANQKELKSEMNLTTVSFADQQNSAEALAAKEVVLSKQYEEQAKKVKVYAAALENSKKMEQEAADQIDKLGIELNDAKEAMQKAADTTGVYSDEYKKASEKVAELESQMKKANDQQEAAEASTKNWQTSLNNANADLVKLNKEVEQNSVYLEEAKNSATGTAKSIDETGKVIRETGEEAAEAGSLIGQIFGGNLLASGAERLLGLCGDVSKELIEMGINAAYAADEIATLSVQTGISTDTLQELEYASELMDTSVDTITGAMSRNIKAMNEARDGSAKYAEAYEKLGIKVTDANGNLRDSEEVFWEVVDALGEIDNQTERDAVSMELFGRSAQQLNPLIQTGADGFAKLAQEARDTGYVLEEDTLEGLLNVSDSLERMSKKTDALKRQIGAEVAPAIEGAIESITETVEENQEEIIEYISKLIEGAANVVNFLIENKDEIELFGTTTLAVVAGGFVAVEVASAGAALAEKRYTAQSVISAAAAAARTIASKGLVAGMAEEIVAMNAAATAALGFNAALLIIPAAVAAVVAAIGVRYAKSIEENALKPTVELSEAVIALRDSFQEVIDQQVQASQARAEDRESIALNADATHVLISELRGLQDQSELTAEEQERQAEIVNQLNTQYPELGLAIDETTGKLSDNIDAIEASIDAMLAQQMVMAAQEDLQEIAAAQYELTKAQTDAERQLAETVESLGIAYDGLNGTYVDTLIQMHEAGEVTDDQYYKVGALITSINALSNEQESLRNQYSDTVTYIEETTGAMGEQETAEANLLTQTVELGNGMNVSVKGTEEAVTESMEKIISSYNAAYDSAKSSIEGQVGLFDELKISSDTSAAQMAVNLQSQTDAFNQYAQDIDTCKQLVEEGLLDEGILGMIEEMGMNGAGYMHELANATEEEIAAISENFAKMEDAKESLVETMTTINSDYREALEELQGSTEETMVTVTTDYNEALGDMQESTEETMTTINADYREAYAELQESTEETMATVTTDYNEALENMQESTEETMVTITETVASSMDDQVAAVQEKGATMVTANMENLDQMHTTTLAALGMEDDDSFSTVYQAIGRNVPESIAEGVTSNSHTLYTAINSMISGMADEAEDAIEDAAARIVSAMDRAMGELAN